MTADAMLARVGKVLDAVPIVAILRGVRSEEAIAVVEALHEAGVRIAEVPLNSPDPFGTIGLLVRHFGSRMLIGAGTVIDPDDVPRLARIGCMLCVAPNADARVIGATVAHGMVPLPGVATASEAFEAVAAGARLLKVFPAADAASAISAWRTVLPKDVRLLAVGGVKPGSASALWAAGARGFGLGADLYRPGDSPGHVGTRARAWVAHVARLPKSAASVLAQPQALVGESVRMDGRDVLWLDPPQARLLRWRGDTGECMETALAHRVWSLGHCPDGRWVGAAEQAFCAIDVETGELSLGPEAPMAPGCRFNDMTVDAQGGLWVGAMHRGLLSGKGGLFHAARVDGPVRQVAAGLGVANGMTFSEDGATLYVIDTLARTLLAYPREGSDGLGEPVVVSDFLALPGKPDGLAMAPDGSFWVAMWGGGCLAHLARDGAFLHAVPLPVPHVGSVCLDADGHALASTSRARLSAEMLQAHPLSGGLFRIDREWLAGFNR
ncbi:2-dehydro-3-deoxy-6-phosphogalactonate aldolase [Dyella sedimenti]|uniref:2-dehydro-3-deoxy-6-phosphogalactonate aldolase n=1 Tax=Dyella sedimenti TaxID=2919947 RepID=UPI001FAAFB9A